LSAIFIGTIPNLTKVSPHGSLAVYYIHRG